MKNFLLFGLLFLAAVSSSAQREFQSQELTGAEASATFEGAEHIWLKQQNTVPAFIRFRAGQEPTEDFFFFYMKKKFHLPETYTFQLQSSEPDGLGWQHKRYQLLVNGVPVKNGQFVTHLQAGKVVKFNGYLFTGLTMETTPALSESAALQKALSDVGALRYKWQDENEEAFLKVESGDVNATFFPKGALEIVQLGSNISTNFRLAWKFDIYAQQPMSRYYVYVDAQTGEVIKKESRICNANANGTAVTAYRGARAIVADSYNGAYRLKETTRGLGIHTYNLQKTTNYGGAVEFTDADNYWNNVNANLDQYAGDAHWGAEMTYDFYQSMGRNSIDNAGYALNLYVHYSTNYLNAFWDGTRMTFGDGSTGYTPLTSLDITGHEISHGLDEKTANLTYQDESGALNESFSDIFGTAIEWYADSTVGNWLIGEDIGSAFRNMSNPNATGDPDTYQGTNWYTGTADNGGVHTNSNVQNHWYYRLSQGGSGTNDIGNAYNVTAIGRHKATQIAWRNMVFYLTSSADYADSRFYAIQSANDLFGACSQEAISTTNAWYAVGVGSAFVFGVDAQFTASPTSGCSVPFTVNFVNSSTNAGAYSWTFGDGSTSTATNPSHTYTSYGLYTVKLIANGGSCGVDSLVSTNLINLNASNPCVVIMKDTGTYTTQTACTGTVYDNGGPSANYTDNTNSVVTIAPTGATSVTLHFTQFNMENTYDYLYVYDGPSTASTLLGSYTGTTLPANITSSGGSITLRQSTDEGVTAAGFTITWSCVAPTLPPVANFSADATQTCTGTVKFTDLSTNTPTSWNWNFGDGQTSTLKNPTHVYANNGTYTVVLTATNAYGNNTLTKTAYITVSHPAGPTVVNQSSCGASAFTLSVNTTDTLSWADSSGTVISNANPFTTPVLTQTRTYWVSSSVTAPSYHVGPTYNAGTASNYNQTTERGLIFNVLKAGVLQSVYVYASVAGNRTIRLLNAGGTALYTTTINIPAGGSRITLNFPLTAGTGYQLTATGPANLYRASSGAVYPYTDAGGIVSITNNTANASGYYYFFYDWIVKENNCISLQTPVTLTVNPAVTLSASSTNATCNGSTNGSATVNVLTGSPAYTFNWSNGANTATANNLGAGTYTVTVTDSKNCTATASKTISQPAALVPSVAKTNVVCNGTANGTATASVTSGGTGPFSYAWNNSATTAAINNLVPATYTVTITDANSCTASASASITQPTALTITNTNVNPTCNGDTNGSIALQLTGATSPYTVTWSNSSTATTLTNLAAGTYSVTARDVNNCSASASYTLTQPTAIGITPTATATTCGNANGAVSLQVSGGTGAYTYNWSNAATTGNINNLSAGNYLVTVTDAANCNKTASAIVASSTGITANATKTNITCNGAANGSITATITAGGTAPFNYAWSNGANTASISNLIAGTYIVTISDAATCTATASASITQPTSLTATATLTNPTCNGSSNGSIALQVSGGTSPYNVNWSNSSTGTTLSNVGSGIYGATITDANNCSVSITRALTQPAAISITPTTTNTSCGNNNGAINLSVNGGTGAYTYQWNTGSTAASLSNLTAGTYNITVRDAALCSSTATATVATSQGVTATTTGNSASCNGAANGSAIVNLSNNTNPTSYSWSNGASTAAISNLTAGNYTVSITDANNCNATASYTVTQPAALALIATATNTNCTGASGAVTLQINGGTGPYSYAWSNGANSASINNLGAGSYSVTVTDANNCTATTGATVNSPGGVNATSTATMVNCHGEATGYITVNISSGTAPYSYAWSNGAGTASISNLAAGGYAVTITDANSCSFVSSTTITEPTAITATITTTNGTCGLSNGSLQTTVSGGTGAYSYVWSNGATTAGISNLSAGTFTVTVSDANSCTVTQQAAISTSPALTLQTSGTDALCYNGTGSASVTAPTGTSPYTYSWSNGSTASNLTNLVAGTYSVTCSDAQGCTATGVATINQPSLLAVTVNTTNAGCAGTNGTANALATGGTGSYSYAWNTGSTTVSLSGISGGNYNVTVTDANNCSSSASGMVNSIGGVTLSTTSHNALCFAQSSGDATVTVNSGTAPYTYSWSNGSSNSSLSNLGAGTYTVSVTDANNCFASATLVINQPTALSTTLSGVEPLCHGNTNGQLTIAVNGGTGAYTYSWSNGATGAIITGITAGTYTVTITDANSCSTTAGNTLSEPAVLTAGVTTTTPLCNGDSNGSIQVNAQGGTGTYTYNWNTGATTANMSGIAGGNYSTTVTDANGCSVTQAVTLNNPAVLAPMATVSDVLCNGGATGSITLTVNGGTPAYSYSWSNGATTAQLNQLAAGNYSVTVQDAHNCSASFTTTVHAPAPISFQVGAADATNGQSNGAAWATNLSGGQAPYSFAWTGFDLYTNDTLYNVAAGTYWVIVTDNNGCTQTDSIVVNAVSGVSNLPIVRLLLFPNPATDVVTLTGELMKEATLSIKNDLGQVLHNQQLDAGSLQKSIPLTLFASGIYYVEIKTTEQRQIKQLVISR